MATYQFDYVHRVRYRECDPMGVVYHTHFVDYFEAARTEALREMGLAYKAITYEVRRRGEETILVTGHVALCFVDAERRRPVRAPGDVQRLFETALKRAA
ncbi:MAG: hypothetical protein GVY15_10970 [Bacteroidetes bacterium]|jgi:acyl-CoA thioester hydrolase|nr:hypothetical protein [Bacteroidota bacterium]